MIVGSLLNIFVYKENLRKNLYTFFKSILSLIIVCFNDEVSKIASKKVKFKIFVNHKIRFIFNPIKLEYSQEI